MFAAEKYNMNIQTKKSNGKKYCNKNKRELDPRKGNSRIFRKRYKVVMKLIDFLNYKGISVKVLQEDSSEVCQFLSFAALFPIRTVSEKRPWLSSERKGTLTKTKLLEHKILLDRSI